MSPLVTSLEPPLADPSSREPWDASEGRWNFSLRRDAPLQAPWIHFERRERAVLSLLCGFSLLKKLVARVTKNGDLILPLLKMLNIDRDVLSPLLSTLDH